MPQITAFGWFMWSLVAAAQLALTVALLHTGLWRRWLSVFVYASTRTVGSFALMLLSHPQTDFGAACYFWTYWGESAVLGVVQVWIVHDIGVSVAGLHKGIRTFIGRLVPAIAIVYVLASALVVHVPAGCLQHFVVAANEATSVAWIATYLTLLLSFQALGVVGDEFERRLSVGFCAQLVANFAAGFLAERGVDRAIISELLESATTAVCLWWIWTFIQTRQREELPSPDDLRALLNRYRAIVKQLRNRP